MSDEKSNGKNRRNDSERELYAYDFFERKLESGASVAEALRDAREQYPELAAELRDYAVSSDLAQSLPQSRELSVLEVKISAISERLSQSRFGAAPEEEKTMDGILSAAKSRGFSLAEFSARLGLAKSALIKLDRRLIDSSSIPQKSIEKIAAALSVRVQALAAYLSAPPAMSAGTSYHSLNKPSLSGVSPSGKESFESALQTCVKSGEMSPEQIGEWL